MRLVIFGSGQGGAMVRRWLSADSELLAFADNDSARWNSCVEGTKVLPPQEALKLQPELVIIAVLNREAEADIATQLLKLGYTKDVIGLSEIRRKVDIRLATLRLLADEVNGRKIPGACAELGVYKGDLARELNALLPDKELFLFDTFEGFADADIDKEREIVSSTKAKTGDFGDTCIELVKSRLPHPEMAHFYKGRFPESAPNDLPPLCLVSLDTDLYEPTKQGLAYFYPRMVIGGIILIHDYNSTQFLGVRKAVREFCAAESLAIIPVPDLHGSAMVVKQ